jgi:hypothetical protein
MSYSFFVGKDGLPQITKDPNASLDYRVDWTDWLGTDTIATSDWTVSPSGGLTIGSSSNASKTATTFLSGGTPGQVVRVTNRITTAVGRIDERSFNVRLIER